MPLGTEVGLGPGDIVLNGAQLSPTKKGARPPNFRSMSIVAKRSPISATAELLFVITSTKAGYVFVVVCLLATLRKNFLTDTYEIFREGLQLAMNRWLNFGGDPHHRLDTGIVFRIRYYWEMGKA